MKDIRTLFQMREQILAILTPKQRRNSIFIIILIFIGSIFELLGVTAILPFIQAILNPSQLYEKWYIKSVLDILGIDNDIQMIIAVGVLIILVYIIKNVYLLFSNYCQIRFKLRLQKDLSVLMLQSYMRRPYSFFVNVNSSEILRGINEDVYGVYAILENFFKILIEGTTICLISLFLIVTDPVMAGGVIVVAILCFGGITLGLRKKMKILGERQRAVVAKQTQYAYQAINGIKEITVMRRNEEFIEQYRDTYEVKRKTDVSFYFAQALPERLIEASCITGIIAMVCIRLSMGIDAYDFVPQLAAFAIAAFRILPAVSRTTGYVSGMIFYRPTLLAAYENLKEVRTYEAKRLEYASNKLENAILNNEIHFDKEIRINNICWKYAGKNENVLNNLYLSISKGEAIGLVGGSGAGKSTLVDIILGLFQPQKGNITMDGIDIYAIPDKWAKIVGYVPQSIYLLDDTIRNNVIFGLNNSNCNDDKIWEALKRAQIDDFVKGLPDQLDTIIGERGIKFSGGQRQRIAIARALYYNPEVLILDEATSALDNETEKAVMEAIDHLHGQVTLIIVAHRLSTIKNCDKIYEIIKGEAVLKDKEEVLGSEC